MTKRDSKSPLRKRVLATYTGEHGWQTDRNHESFTTDYAAKMLAAGVTMVRVRIGLTKMREVSTEKYAKAGARG